jgi:Fe(3+) dicitrate transport protein
MGYAFSKKYRITGGINNLLNLSYFSQRITFYPGHGILPADGRTFYVSF